MSIAPRPFAQQRPHSSLSRYFSQLQRYLWARRAVSTLLIAAGLVGGLALVSRLLLSIGAEGAGQAAVLLAGMVLVGSVIAAFRARPTAKQAARAADTSFGLHARLGTAQELLDRGDESALAQQQIADAEDMANRYPAGAAFRGGQRLVHVAVAATLIAFAAIAWVWLPDLSAIPGSPFAPRAAEAQPEEPQLQSTETDLSQNNADDVIASIEDLRRRIAERSIDGAEASRLLAQAESRLNSKIENSNTQQQNLQNLADALRQSAASQDIAGAIDRGDYSGAVDQLNNLARDADQLSDSAKRELAKALDQAAAQTTNNPQLRDAERRASQALNRGDYKEIERALRNLGDQISGSGRDVIPQNQLGKANDQLNQARQELSQSGLGSEQGGDQPGNTTGGSQAPGISQQGTSSNGSQAGTAQGQNQQGSGQQQAQQNQGQNQGSSPNGNQRPGDLPQQEGSGDRLGISGKPVQIDAPDSGGGLRPNDGKGEQRGSQVGGARPVSGAGVAQPTDPVDGASDYTRIAPDRRPAIRSYFSPGTP